MCICMCVCVSVSVDCSGIDINYVVNMMSCAHWNVGTVVMWSPQMFIYSVLQRESPAC